MPRLHAAFAAELDDASKFNVEIDLVEFGCSLDLKPICDSIHGVHECPPLIGSRSPTVNRSFSSRLD